MKGVAQTKKDKTLSAVEELAQMTKRGFDHVDKRFDGVDERLDRIEHFLIKKHDLEINDLKQRIRNIEDLFAIPSRKR